MKSSFRRTRPAHPTRAHPWVVFGKWIKWIKQIMRMKWIRRITWIQPCPVRACG
ncbi:hypothetical protein [Streptomyces spiramyceticus]|uniref:hypothetical protein n=1 Tax=Streptomyces spiramyceticus TaxID=299717 RepID=UPI00237C137C|nr:hypothetical protein [Streptomyces spiramyceticus]